MLSDLKSAFRQLAASPGFSAVVILTLAFGVAVNITIFGMVRMLLLRRLPVPGADRLVLVAQRDDTYKMPHGLSFPDFKDYRERARQVRDLVAYMPGPVNLGAKGQAPERAWVEVVTPNAFQALGVPAALGRTLLPGDGEAAGSAPVTVLSYDCWQNRFGADPSIVGRALILNGHPFTVVGVARQGFHSFSVMWTVSAFVPTGALDSLQKERAGLLKWRNASGTWRIMGKLAPGATLASARAEAAVIMNQLVRDYPDDHHHTQAVVFPESHARPDPAFADFIGAFTALFVGLVGLVLFIACANVANLLFARAATRQKELTLRAALGASRGRLVRQMLIESLPLAALAGTAAWLIAEWGGGLLSQLAPQSDIPVNPDPGSVWPAVVFTAAISLVAALGSGLLPALRASRVNLVDDLKDGSGQTTRGRHRIRNLFVVSQVTFSAVVLICAGLFLRSLQHLRNVDLGFRPDHLLLVSFDLGLQGYSGERGQVFTRQLLERVNAIPGAHQASLTSHMPFDPLGYEGRDIRPENPPPRMKDGNTSVGMAHVAPGFLELMGMRRWRGRTLAPADAADAPRVAVVNRALATLCWPGQEAVGRRFRPWKDGPWIQVVGVVDNSKYLMLTEPARPYFYEPLAQDYTAPLTLVVRTKADPNALTGPVRAVFRRLDPNLPLYGERTMEDLMGGSPLAYLPMRMGVMLTAAQGLIGLCLAMMGLFAVVSFGVAQRTREIGIRMALGADAPKVVRFVMREAFRLTVVGLGAGFALALLLGLGLSRILYGLSPVDLPVVGGVTLLLSGTALLACWLPARRATGVDPVIALRAE